ncbi:MAG: hypothetical protein ABII00_07445 [Elusimicrobiota bacterium]
MKYGPGLRLRYEFENKTPGGSPMRVRTFWTGLFFEHMLMVESLNNADGRIPNTVHSRNSRFGSETWLMMDTPELNSWSVWWESWTELIYNRHNFNFKNTLHYYSLAFQPRLGARYRFDRLWLQPYYTFRLGLDLGRNPWNQVPWFNNIQHGPGFRVLLERFKFKPGLVVYAYVESLRVNYLPKVTQASRANISRYDNRATIEFWVPFGALKMTPYGS